MRIVARIENRAGEHRVVVSTNGTPQSLTIPAKPAGQGSNVNGGELLFLALATCYCNDVYREAARRNIRVESVAVDVEGEFGAPGEPGHDIRYRAEIVADAPEDDVRALAADTDRVAEIHNTLRSGATVTMFDVAVTRPSR